jgi:hypothetical protein
MGFYSENPIIQEPVSSVTATNSVELGTRIVIDGRQYCYVYNAGNSQAIPGNGVVVTGVSGYSVTISSITNVDAPVGVVYHATLTTGTYGWVVVAGHTKIKMHANSICTTGDLLSLGADGVFSAGALAGTSIVAPYVAGKAVLATVSAGVAEGYVQCLYAV